MKILITENQKHLLRLVSRFSEFVERQIEFYQKLERKLASFCMYYDEDSFVNKVINRSVDDLIDDQWRFFKDETNKGGSNMDLDLLYSYVRTHYAKQIIDVFRSKCGKSITESKIDFARRIPVVKEERKPTETEPLYWKLPKKMVAQLGFELFKEEDVVYITEIHFDTQNVLFELFSRHHSGGEIHYADDVNVPGDFRANILIPIKKLPRNVLTFIGRRLDPQYIEYIDL